MFSWLNKLFSRNYAKGCPVHFQSEATECGAVSLGMIMEYYGVILTLEVLRDECQVSRDGCKASSLLQTARKYGFQANGFHAPTPDSILQCQMPAIIFWEFNHFVVCIGKEGDQWVLHDPAVGKRLVSEEEMSKSFTGLILEIIPGPGFHKTGKKPSFLWSLVALTAPGMSEMSLLFLIGLFLIPGTILRPNMNSLMIDYYFQHGYINWGTPLLFLGLFFLLITAGLIFFEQKTLLFLNLKMSVCNSYLLIKKMFRLPLHFFQVRFSGDLTQCLQYSEIISNFVSEKMVRNTLNLLSIILFGLLLFQFDSILGALVVIFVLILMLILISFFDRKKVNSTRETFTNAKLMGRVVHGISMIESIKSSGMENEFFIFWNDLYKKCAKVRMELHDQDLFLEFLQSTQQNICMSILIGFGAYRILQGNMTSGTYMSFQMIFACFMAPIIATINITHELQLVQAYAGRVLGILRYPYDVHDQDFDEQEPDGETTKMDGSVSIRGLTFGYNRNLPPVIDHIDLDIAPGERIAVVGVSGSGKSTLAKLIAGSYEPWEGEILFDGRPRKSYTAQELRYSFAMVDQDIVLFPGNLYENISMFDNMLPFNCVKRAAEDAQIHDTIISRVGSYSCQINATASNFSGGERQRLEIARALAVNPAILVLDEATAALDPTTEQKIDHNLRRRGVTTIVIAHRLSTIRDADRIIVLEHGKIAELGTHDQLMKLNSIYARLVKL